MYSHGTLTILTMTPTTYRIYYQALYRATPDQIEMAIKHMKDQEGNKTRIKACERELRRRGICINTT